MSGTMSRLRRDRSERRELAAEPDRGLVEGASASGGLAHGTELGRAHVGARLIAYEVGAGTSIWCMDAHTGAQIGVISWGDCVTPHLRCAPNDEFNEALGGPDAERAVWCGMAAWRRVFMGLAPDPALRLTLNPHLVSMQGRR